MGFKQTTLDGKPSEDMKIYRLALKQIKRAKKIFPPRLTKNGFKIRFLSESGELYIEYFFKWRLSDCSELTDILVRKGVL